MFRSSFLPSIFVFLLFLVNFSSTASLASSIATPENSVKNSQATETCNRENSGQYPCPP